MKTRPDPHGFYPAAIGRGPCDDDLFAVAALYL